MKKKIITLILVVMLCCSSFCILTACGDGAKLTYNGQTIGYTQNTEVDLINPNTKWAEILKGTSRGTFTLGDEEGITFETIQSEGGQISGFQLSQKGSFHMSVSYKGYTCSVEYTVA